MPAPILWYFADPMCAWCWGFSPVIEALRDAYRERLRIALVLGGLRSDTAAVTPAQRDDLLQHWHAVQARTGQPFRLDGALPGGFVYDTEPACRAVATAGGFDPTLTFPLFKSIQHAFYAEARDVTQADVLAELAAALGLSPQAFGAAFESDDARRRVHAHFRQARLAGVHGFPALILQRDDRLTSIGQGCQSLDAVRDAIESSLSA